MRTIGTLCPLSGSIDAWTEVVESPGPPVVMGVTISGQRLTLTTRTRFPAMPNEPLWLRPGSDKRRWLDLDTSQVTAVE